MIVEMTRRGGVEAEGRGVGQQFHGGELIGLARSDLHFFRSLLTLSGSRKDYPTKVLSTPAGWIARGAAADFARDCNESRRSETGS